MFWRRWWRWRRGNGGGGGSGSVAAVTLSSTMSLAASPRQKVWRQQWRWRQQRRLAGSVEALGQGCEVWASLLMPLGTVVVEEERRRIAKMFQGIGGGGEMGAP